MCDYSLFEHPNRLAVEGEELVTHRFPSRTLGLASPLELRRSEAVCGSVGQACTLWSVLKRTFTALPAPVAVCVPPGARLRLEQIPASFRKQYGLEENEEVTFVQTTVYAHTHRDAIRFETGTEVLLQHVPERQQIRVLTLCPEDGQALIEPDIQEAQDAEVFRSRSW